MLLAQNLWKETGFEHPRKMGLKFGTAGDLERAGI